MEKRSAAARAFAVQLGENHARRPRRLWFAGGAHGVLTDHGIGDEELSLAEVPSSGDAQLVHQIPQSHQCKRHASSTEDDRRLQLS